MSCAVYIVYTFHLSLHHANFLIVLIVYNVYVLNKAKVSVVYLVKQNYLSGLYPP